MKKLWLFLSLLICSILFTWCNFHLTFNDTSSTVDKDKPSIKTESWRLFACNEEVWKYLNITTFGGAWDTEEEAWASFVLDWEITYEKDGETTVKNFQCVVDMVDNSVTIIEIEETAEEVNDIINDEKLLSLYPWIQENDWNVIIWDTLQTNYINWTNNLYYDPYRWFAFKLWAEFDWWLIREIDTDEWGFPHSEVILLVRWEENEENRTWINWFREVYTIRVDSKTNLKNFNINPDLANAIWENNEYYFVWYGIDTNIHFSDLQIFDVEKKY